MKSQAEVEKELEHVRAYHRKRLEAHTKVEPYILYWGVSSAVVAILIGLCTRVVDDKTLFFMSLFVGAIVAFFAREFHYGSKLHSEKASKLRDAMESELEGVRTGVRTVMPTRAGSATRYRRMPAPPKPVARAGSKWQRTMGGLQEEKGPVFIPAAALRRIKGANPGFEVVPTCYGVCFIPDADVLPLQE